ncbi:MAG: CoA transferase [Candidatus Eremiobacteraeota bacterium]|nr:CoA transferase [Candidatus Eremiobacteraeota bacterium]
MGPSCGVVLGDLGADVIKVEAAPNGDPTRVLKGFGEGFFPCFNRNKRSLLVDLRSDRGREIVERLVGTADVFVENFGPGTLERLGFGAERVMTLNPRIIYCSLKGFLSGPYEKRPALDEVIQYMTGLAYMTGPLGRPLRMGTSIIDILGGVFDVLGILCALRERERTGKGELVKSALFETGAFLVAQHIAADAISGTPGPPMPERSGSWAIYETFETSDNKRIFIGITSNNIWERFAKAYGREDALSDPDFASNESRRGARWKLVPLVAKIAKGHTFAEMAEILERESVPFAPVAVPSDLFSDPQLNALHRMLETHIDGKSFKLPRVPLELGNDDIVLRRQPPTLGEHNEEILKELGM